MQVNPPKRDLNSELRALINDFGREEVKEAARKLTARKRGRPQDNDFPLLKS